MNKKLGGILLTLCMFLMPAIASADTSDTLTVSSDMKIEKDATYGAMRINNNATLTVEKGVTLTIDGVDGITDSNSSFDSSLVLVTDGNIILNEGATLNIVNASEKAYAAFRTTGNTIVTMNGATLNVSDNKTRGMDNTMGLTMTMTSSTLKVNNKGLVHFSYERYLVNQIRKEFGLEGTPVRIIVREKRD